MQQTCYSNEDRIVEAVSSKNKGQHAGRERTSGCRGQNNERQRWHIAEVANGSRTNRIIQLQICRPEWERNRSRDLTDLRSTSLLAVGDSNTSAPVVSCPPFLPSRTLVEAWEKTSLGTFGWRHRNTPFRRPRGPRFPVVTAVRRACVVSASYTALAGPGGSLMQRGPLAQYTMGRQSQKSDNTLPQRTPWDSIPAVVGLHKVGTAEHESPVRVCELKVSRTDGQTHHVHMAGLDNGTAVLDAAAEE